MRKLTIERINGILIQAEVDCARNIGLRYGQAVFNRLPNEISYRELQQPDHNNLWSSNDRHFVKTYVYDKWWNQHD